LSSGALVPTISGGGTVFRLGPRELERRADGHQHRFGCEWLLEELEGAELDRLHGIVELRLPAHHDDRQGGVTLLQSSQGLDPHRARRHHEVEQHQVGTHFIKVKQRRVATRCFGNLESLGAQQRAEHAADVRFVVDNQDSRAHYVPFADVGA
jgi:hypothetical protein